MSAGRQQCSKLPPDKTCCCCCLLGLTVAHSPPRQAAAPQSVIGMRQRRSSAALGSNLHPAPPPGTPLPPSSYLLPPIIFHCGLSVEKRGFFVNLPTICLFGIVGTLASFLLTGIFLYLLLGFAMFKLQDALAMGAIFAATDSVAVLSVGGVVAGRWW